MPGGMAKARANKASNRTRQAPCVVDVRLRSRSDCPCLSLAGYLASPSSSKENHNAGNRRPAGPGVLALVTVYLWHRPEPLFLTQLQPRRPLHYRPRLPRRRALFLQRYQLLGATSGRSSSQCGSDTAA